MKQGKIRPALSLKKALLKSSSSRSVETDTPLPMDTDSYLIEIIPNLFIANYSTVKDSSLLEEKNIRAVINLISHKCQNTHPDKFLYENFELADNPSENLAKIAETIVYQIERHLKEGYGVVVHGWKGVSRAPAAIMAYLMKVRRMSFEAAFDLVKGRSQRIDPNAGFLMQLNYLFD